MQWTAPQGFFGPLAMIALPYNEYLQRYGATRDAMAAVLVEARKNGARIPWSYWHDQPAHRRRLPRRADDLRPDLHARLRHPRRRRRRVRVHLGRAGRTCRTDRCTSRASRAGLPTAPAPVALAPRRHHGRRLRHRARGSGRTPGSGPHDVDLPQLYDGFSPFIYFWLEVLGFCPVGEAHAFVQDGGIASDGPVRLPVLSGGGALGNGRMHGVPQMLECYLQLSRRAGDRQRAVADGRSRVPLLAALRRCGGLPR